MGLFSFVKNAGAKLFKTKRELAADSPNAEQAQAEFDAQKAIELENLINGLGFEVKDFYVEVNNDTAALSGTVDSIDDKERIILACGNVNGIAQVDDRLEVAGMSSPVEYGPIAGADTDYSDTPTLTANNSGSDSDETSTAEVATSQFHTVVKGDSLSKIAKKYYGNALKYIVIFEANRPMLKSPDRIYAGQVLRIPPLA